MMSAVPSGLRAGPGSNFLYHSGRPFPLRQTLGVYGELSGARQESEKVPGSGFDSGFGSGFVSVSGHGFGPQSTQYLVPHGGCALPLEERGLLIGTSRVGQVTGQGEAPPGRGHDGHQGGRDSLPHESPGLSPQSHL